MRLLHWAPVSEVRKIRRNGVAISRYSDHRANGVYAVPVLDLPKASLAAWKRVLGQEAGRGKHFAGIVFEIPDDELVFVFADFTDNAFGEHKLVEAHKAEATAKAIAEKNREPLSPELFAALVSLGRVTIDPNDQPYYGVGLMEIVVPRRVKPGEIVLVLAPTRRGGKSF